MITTAATPSFSDNYTSAWAQYTLTFASQEARDATQRQLKNHGVPSMIYYPKPLHHQEAYQNCPRIEDLSCSERLSQTVLSLPMHAYLSAEDQNAIVDALNAI